MLNLTHARNACEIYMKLIMILRTGVYIQGNIKPIIQVIPVEELQVEIHLLGGMQQCLIFQLLTINHSCVV